MTTSSPTSQLQAPRGSSNKAIVLLSGGLDSATVLAMAQEQGFECHCLAFSYGQRHDVELDCAADVASHQKAASFQIVDIDLRAFGGSALTADVAVPKDADLEKQSAASNIPITYVPARNTIFLSFALAKAEVTGASDLFIGANAVDYSGYPDCRPEFIEAFERLANVATKVGVEGNLLRVQAPLMKMGKAEIVTVGTRLGVDYALTHSCYDPIEKAACGRCDSCRLRSQGFVDAGVPDSTLYSHKSA
ncbi:MAG: 7-cyano-7-deazaguanine synthase QueC [Deltaproteobacteria bacterium]|nr:7-cyano-7-deazaguanine synthase QueC [Deltaproteobacteria bacterium]